ncbi:hypothetical protein EFA69_13100 [Rufibacter immobilis]|uniref:Uncharacterized protein n=2 Tax=Rufibacter immobilis TaxID=1348778 RepID=A0A3M9MPG8_9BACT|nr:hypothetical protein EFA69_13100 [Rufibacter immobilis]
MRWKSRNIVLLLLVFSLLTGSVGMAATQRFCAMLGMDSKPAASKEMKAMGCCTKKQKPTSCPEAAAKVEKQKCCSVSTTHHKLDVQSALKFDKVEVLTLQPMLVSSFLLPQISATAQSSTWPLYTDTSPPLAGKDLLHRLHILII